MCEFKSCTICFGINSMIDLEFFYFLLEKSLLFRIPNLRYLRTEKIYYTFSENN